MNGPNISQKDIDLIEKYLDGNLTKEETESVEKKLNEDTGFLQLFRIRKEVQNLWIQARSFEATKEEVRSIYIESFIPVKNKSKISPLKAIAYRHYAIAATVLILIGTTFVLIFFYESHVNSLQSEKKKKENNSINIQKPEEQPEKGSREFYSKKNLILSKPDSNVILEHNKEIVFQWTFKGDTSTHFLIISKDNYQVIYQKKVNPSENKLILPCNTLQPGMYYWYVGNKIIKRGFTIK